MNNFFIARAALPHKDDLTLPAEDVANMIKVIENAKTTLNEYGNDVGDDHSVGICNCDIKEKIADLEQCLFILRGGKNG